MSTEQKKPRFDFSHHQRHAQTECENFVREHKLDGRVRQEDFLMGDKTHMEVLQQLLLEDADSGVVHDQTLVAIAQRMIWLADEVGSLRRTNRNLRSKNLRLKRGKQEPQQLPAHYPALVPGQGYQPLPIIGKAIPQHPPKGR